MIRALVVSSRLRLRGSRVQGRTRATSSSASSPAARNAVCSDHESVQDDFKSYTLAGLDHGVQMLSLVSHLQEISSIVKAALTSGTLSALGDTLAQLLVRNQLQKEHGINKSFELERTARMFSFGLLWYGMYLCTCCSAQHGHFGCAWNVACHICRPLSALLVQSTR